MPGIPPIYEPDDKHINQLADDERQARINMIDENWRYYYGEHHKPLVVRPGERDDNIIINLVGAAVDKTTEFMGIPELSIVGGVDNVVVDGRINVQKSPEQELLDAIVDRSELEMLLPDTITSGAISGHNFWRIAVDSDENGGVVSAQHPPYLMLLDARFVTVFWDAMNPKQVLYYRLQWEVGDVGWRQDIVPGYLVGENLPISVNDDEWVIIEYVKKARKVKFEFERAEIWHYPFSPIVQWKNRRKPHSFYGDHDLRDTSLNDALNFLASNTARIIKHHAHPKTIGTGMSMQDVAETAVDGFFTVENEQARIENLEMQSDLQSSMAMIEMIRSNFFSQMRVVDISGMKDRIGQVSNFGVRMMFDDMLKMIGDKQSRYGERGIAEAFRRMLYMVGVDVDDILVTWDDPLPMDRKELVETAEKEKNLGITSGQTLASDLKRDYVKEQKQLEEEAQITTDSTIDLITRISQAGGGQ